MVSRATTSKSRSSDVSVSSNANVYKHERTDHPSLVVTFSVDGSPIGLNESRRVTHSANKGGKHTMRPFGPLTLGQHQGLTYMGSVRERMKRYTVSEQRRIHVAVKLLKHLAHALLECQQACYEWVGS